MKQKFTIVSIFIIIILFLYPGCDLPVEEGPTASPTPSPTPTPTEVPTPTVESTPYPTPMVAGDVWIVPEFSTVAVQDTFNLEVHVNSGDTQLLAAYGIDIMYHEVMLEVLSVTAGVDGFVSAVNTNTPGIIDASGFDALGKGPGSDLHLLTIEFIAHYGPYSEIGITVNMLVDVGTNDIGTPNGISGVVNITGK